jgi:hypothetical protein
VCLKTFFFKGEKEKKKTNQGSGQRILFEMNFVAKSTYSVLFIPGV